MNSDIAANLGLHLDLALGEDQNTYNEALQAMLVAPRKFPPGTLNNRGPVDMRNPTAVSTLRRDVADQITLTDDDNNQYHWAVVRTDTHPALHVLLLGEEVADFLRRHHALTMASKLGLLVYVQPVNLRDPKSTQLLREQFGETAVIPPVGPHRYLVQVNGMTVLLPGPDVITFVCDQWALAQGDLHEVWTTLGPIDLGQTADRVALANAVPGDTSELPTDGLFHLVRLNPPGRPQRMTLIPLGDAWASVRVLIPFGPQGRPHEDDINPEGLLPL